MRQPPEDPEQRLLRLLALKRYEVPPPGFFDQLPARILVSLRAGSEVPEVAWWSRAWRSLMREPMVGLSYAALGMATVVFGISVVETAFDTQTTHISPTLGQFPVGSTVTVTDAVNTDLALGAPWGGDIPGLIYRVSEPSMQPTPANWFQAGLFAPNPSPSPFAKPLGTRVEIPVLVPASSVIHVR